MIVYLLRLGVSDLGRIDPILRLLVIRVVNLLGRVDSRLEVLEEVSALILLAIDKNLKGVVGARCEIRPNT